MRLVLDTAVMVAAIRSATGASRRLLEIALSDQSALTLLITVPLLIEYEAVMTRPEHLRAARGSVNDIERLLDAVAAAAQTVDPAFLWRPGLRDADDDMVLEAAVNGRANAIVTFNIRDFEQAARRFGVDTLRPAEALKRVRGAV